MSESKGTLSTGPARVLRLPQGLDRRVQSHIDEPGTPYETLSDFAEAAFRNQLELEKGDFGPALGGGVVARPSEPTRPESPRRLDDGAAAVEATDVGPVPELMAAVSDVPSSAVASVEVSPPAPSKYLSFLVNRLNPLPAVCRSLARTAPQDFEGLHAVVGEPARLVGVRLKSDDVIKKRAMVDRLATSWPVGDDAKKSINKFLAAYVGDSGHPGALVQLGLGVWDDFGKLRLTPLGADLARCESPILDSVSRSHGSVSDEAIRILKQAISWNPAELELVTAFLEAVSRHHGSQAQVDGELAQRMDWSPDVAASTRAALVGRLRDLNVVEVSGRGAKALISVVDAELFALAAHASSGEKV